MVCENGEQVISYHKGKTTYDPSVMRESEEGRLKEAEGKPWQNECGSESEHSRVGEGTVNFTDGLPNRVKRIELIRQ